MQYLPESRAIFAARRRCVSIYRYYRKSAGCRGACRNCRRANVSVNKLFNTSGLQYRELNIKERLPALSDQQKLDLLAANGRLIKRPLIADGDRATVGFDDEQFAAIWL